MRLHTRLAANSSVTGTFAVAQQATKHLRAASLFRPGVDASPAAVAEEITRILALPPGAKPFRSVIDFTDAGVNEINAAARTAQEQYQTLTVHITRSAGGYPPLK